MLVESLSHQSGISVARLLRIARSASRRYHEFYIPKRNGELRLIEHPGRELKAIQRWIAHVVLSRLQLHKSASAYREGASIRKHATRHKNTNFTLKMDFRDFFPSFHKRHVKEFLISNRDKIDIAMSDDDIDFICSIVLRNGRLTIGSPASPVLTNAMMLEFDTELAQICKSKKVIYTRYADDIFMSSVNPKSLNGLAKTVRQMSRNYRFSALRVNGDKTAYLSKKYKRSITGLNITTTGNVSIGRDKKRLVKSLVFDFINGRIESDKILYLKGMLAYIADVEPTFILSLKKKYGSGHIQMIRE